MPFSDIRIYPLYQRDPFKRENGDIRLSKRVIGDPPQQEGANKGVTVPLEKLRRYYWSEMGFDPETGVPTPECLARLNLEI